jgi:hypothetical protein
MRAETLHSFELGDQSTKAIDHGFCGSNEEFLADSSLGTPNPSSGLAEIFTWFLFRPLRMWLTCLLFQSVGLALCFIGFSTLLCHATVSHRPPSNARPVEIQTAPLPKIGNGEAPC